METVRGVFERRSEREMEYQCPSSRVGEVRGVLHVERKSGCGRFYEIDSSLWLDGMGSAKDKVYDTTPLFNRSFWASMNAVRNLAFLRRGVVGY